MANTKNSTDVNLTVFDILQAVTGELPCYASPNWQVGRQVERPAKEEAFNQGDVILPKTNATTLGQDATESSLTESSV